MSNANLAKARFIKNDEFYTLYEDIEKEISNYENQFKNKIIYCNCDSPKESNFWKFFIENFQKLKIKKLIAVSYDESIRYEYDGDKIDNVKLNSTGDFRSDECIKFLKESDIIVINPPFSLFREYLNLLINYNKNFLILGNKNSIFNKSIFNLFLNGIIKFGYNNVTNFRQPDNSIKKFGNITWFTNLEVNKPNIFINLTKTYNPKDYLKYDNFNAINVDKLKDIPKDYRGIIGVPISILDKLPSNQFELIWYASGNLKDSPSYILNNILHYKKHKEDRGGAPVMNGKRKFTRCFIKLKI